MLATASRIITARQRLLLLQPLQVRCFSDEPKQKQQKAKKKGKKSDSSSQKGADTAAQRNIKLLMESLDAPYRKEGPVSAQEMERRAQVAKNYTIGSFRQHNEIDHDLNCKLKMKQHAIRMMKTHPELKEAALQISDEMPPRWRQIPVWTPPIAGFDPSTLVDEEEED